jgi:single-stranded-DNA-specific exonuclease
MIQQLKDHFERLKANPHPLEIDFDTTANLSEVNPQVMKWYDFIGPFGVGFQVPIIQFREVVLSSAKDLKGGHLKLQLSDLENKNKIDALLFSPTESIKQKIAVGQTYNLLSELQWNYFNGQKTIQLLVKDLKPL